MTPLRSRESYENLVGKLVDRTVLVTGGAGFLGSNIVERVRQLGSEVTVLDDFSTSRRELLPNHPKLRIVKGDLRDEEIVSQCVRD